MRVPVLALALAAGTLLYQDDAQRSVAPEVGKPAPAFRLNDHAGKAVTVGPKEGRWTVLAFFPKAATPG